MASSGCKHVHSHPVGYFMIIRWCDECDVNSLYRTLKTPRLLRPTQVDSRVRSCHGEASQGRPLVPMYQTPMGMDQYLYIPFLVGSLGTRVLTHCRIYDYSCWVYVLICDQLRSPNFKSAQMISRRVHDGCTSVEGKTCSPRPLINFPVICARLNEKRLLIIWIFWIL